VLPKIKQQQQKISGLYKLSTASEF
jgi:hypothetical protein